MVAKFRIVKLLVAVLLVAHCVHCDSQSQLSRKAIIEARTYKPIQCFVSCSLEYECELTIHGNRDHRVVRWAYDALAKVCVPLYIYRWRSECPKLRDLPYTKKECEHFCGEPCTVTYKNNKTEPGICMSDCHVPIANGVPLPCPPGQTRCCPRSYTLPTTTPVPVTNQNIMPAQIQQYAVLGIIMNIHNHPINESRDLTPMMLVNDTSKLL